MCVCVCVCVCVREREREREPFDLTGAAVCASGSYHVCGFIKGVRALSLSPSFALPLSPPSLFLLPSKGTFLSLRHLSFFFLFVGLRVLRAGGVGRRAGQRAGKQACLSVRSLVRLRMRVSADVTLNPVHNAQGLGFRV